MYSVQLSNAARRIFKKFHNELQEKLKAEMHSLEENPQSGEPLQGRFKGLRSLHLSLKGVTYRIVYRVYPDDQVILVLMADKRENIYKRLEEAGI